MNRKKKKQLLLLIILCVLLIGIFVFLKMMPEEESQSAQETERYSVINIDKSMITEIGITTKEGTLDLYKVDDTWKVTTEESIKLDNTKVENFLQKMCVIDSENKIEEVSDLSEYGLKDPIMQITLQWENNLYTIKAGDYNSVINSYYISINDEQTVYTTDSTVYNVMNKTLEDFKAESTEEAAEENTEESSEISETE